MNFKYKNIRALFHLDHPAPLLDEQIQKIRENFGSIPKALENYYLLCGGCEEMNSTQDFLVVPDGRYGHYYPEAFDYPDYCVFYVENQCVSEWAVKKSDLDQDDPPVYETYDNGETWYKTSDSAAQFLTAQAYLQRVFSYPYSSEDFLEADTDQTNEIIDRFTRADADSALYNGTWFFLPYPDTIIVVMHSHEGIFDVFYSSESERHFVEVDELLSGILYTES